MARLPTPGSDNGNWGNILNEFLEVSHNTDGSLKAGATIPDDAVVTSKIANGAVTSVKIDPALIDAAAGVASLRTLGTGANQAMPGNATVTPGAHAASHKGGGSDVIDSATTSLAGLMSGGDKTKLDGVATGATANSADATLLARANHTGTQTASTISDFNAAADARIAAETSTGTGTNVRDTSPTIVTPTIASLTNAQHNHTNAAGGGQITDAALSSAVGVAKGGTGNTTATTAYGLIAAGTTATGAFQTLATGSSGQILKSNGNAALPTFQTGAAADVGLSNVPNTNATLRSNHTGTQTASTISDFNSSAQALTAGSGSNIRSTVLAKARKAYARVRTQGGNMRILCIGDSTTAGFNAASLANTYPHQLMTMLNAYFIPTVAGILFPNSSVTDTRVATGTGWSVATQHNFGSGWFNGISGAAGTLSFTLPQSFDTIKVYYYKNSGHGTSTINVDGGASLGNIVGSGSSSLNAATFNCAAGIHTVNITGPSGGQIFIAGIECTLSTASTVTVTNGGRSGYTTLQLSSSTNPYDAQQCYAAYQPDLTIISIGINDATGSLAQATYESRLTTTIGYAQTTGDVILVPPIPSSGAPYTTFEPQYSASMRTLASSLGCGLVDTEARWVNYTTSNAQGFMSDTLHPNALGYSDMATMIFHAISKI